MVSALSLAANVAVAVYQVRVIVTRRLNPLKDELFTHLRPYREVLEANAPLDATRPVPRRKDQPLAAV